MEKRLLQECLRQDTIRTVTGEPTHSRVTIPKTLCRAYRIEPGILVTWWLRADGHLWLGRSDGEAESGHHEEHYGLRLWGFETRVCRSGTSSNCALPSFVRHSMGLIPGTQLHLTPYCCHLILVVPILRDRIEESGPEPLFQRSDKL